MPIPVPVEGVVQHYAWGDLEFIPRLVGRPADGRPWAELWLGTHPNGPATIDGMPLHDVTGDLPFLLKVLAAAEPLSLQAHPTTEQAIDGYARGVYPDASAKPELLCALTPFEALCGVRPADATVALLEEIGAIELAQAVAAAGPGAAMRRLYLGELDPRPAIDACAGWDRPEAVWATRLGARYPGEPSVAVTLLLNYVRLQPGEALHLTAGNLHAYLGGAGVELMGASDNVVRGGMTEKEVDVDELLRVIDPTPLVEPVLPASGEYALPEAGSALLRLEPGRSHESNGHELAVSLDGTTLYLPPGSQLTPSTTTFVALRR